MTSGRRPTLPDDFVRQHGKTNYSLIKAAKDIGVDITDGYATYKRRLLGLPTNWPIEKKNAIMEFLRKHPYATGQNGVELYNNDPDFGKHYGEISPQRLYIFRARYGKELALPRGKNHLRSEVDNFIKSHADIHDSLSMKKLIKEELGFDRRTGYIGDLMKKCGTYRDEWKMRDEFINEHKDIKDPYKMSELMTMEFGSSYHDLQLLRKKMKATDINIVYRQRGRRSTPKGFIYNFISKNPSATSKDLAPVWNSEHPERQIDDRYFERKFRFLGLGNYMRDRTLFVYGHSNFPVRIMKRLYFAETGKMMSEGFIKRSLNRMNKTEKHRKMRHWEHYNEQGIPIAFWERMKSENRSHREILSELKRGYGIDESMTLGYVDYMLEKVRQREMLKERMERKRMRKSTEYKPSGTPVPEYIPPLNERECTDLQNVVTLPKFVKSLMASNTSMNAAEASQIGNYVLGFFGHDGRITDNVLTDEDRDAFYILEEVFNLLTTDREISQLLSGKYRRINWWLLCNDRIIEKANEYDRMAVKAIKAAARAEEPLNNIALDDSIQKEIIPEKNA